MTLATPSWAATPVTSSVTGPVTGSAGCKDCHQRFHQLWATSLHGLAMRPYAESLAETSLQPMRQALSVGQARYQAETGPGQGWITETRAGETQRYPITAVLGGKDVLYFLTPMDRGRLQTLPLAYDVHLREWFDMAASGVRHAGSAPGSALDWKDPAYTFNTSCHGCHVSQLATNYDPASDTYHSTWTEPGINCESCHGPGQAHVAACQQAPEGQTPIDLRIIRGGRSFSHAQQNDLCASCHAKAVALSAGLAPGECFFDHFDPVTLEHADFYPDGRDLGENYTYASWSRSPCVRSGTLDCLHCHTSSGRYKFADPATANQACAPCHAERVAEAPAHTHHPAGSPGNQCVACHMPTTSFARIRRSDHSMLPPAPAATLACGSPNACTDCHAEKDAAWADRQVRDWHARDYQAPVLQVVDLIQAGRRRDWSRLPQLLEYIVSERADPVVAASLLRLLGGCPLADKEPALLAAAGSPWPLVRAAAGEALAGSASPAAVEMLRGLTADMYRLVRIQAAAALVQAPQEAGLTGQVEGTSVQAAVAEYLAFLNARSDLWSSQYNLGNYYLEQGDTTRAAACFETAIRLSPSSLPPRINAAIAHARLGAPNKAQHLLEEALQLQPGNAAAHCNLGLLQAERGNRAEAEGHLRAALAADPTLAMAAYNLGVLLAGDHPQEALALCRQAARLRPDMPNYAYTVAFIEASHGNRTEAARTLLALLQRHPGYRDASRLLAAVAPVPAPVPADPRGKETP